MVTTLAARPVALSGVCNGTAYLDIEGYLYSDYRKFEEEIFSCRIPLSDVYDIENIVASYARAINELNINDICDSVGVSYDQMCDVGCIRDIKGFKVTIDEGLMYIVGYLYNR